MGKRVAKASGGAVGKRAGGRAGTRVKKASTAVEAAVPEELIDPPRTPDELLVRLERLLEVKFGRRALLAGSDAPLAYLVHSFFEGAFVLLPDGSFARRDGESALPADCVVWAARGGGKTFLGAVATLLDLLYKPGIEVRVLGGSLEQSRRMHEHLRRFFDRPELAALLDGRPTEKRVRLRNGSRVEVLAQSEASVRGTRVQKLRCDEADLFDRAVWDAAQLTTRQMRTSGPWGAVVQGSVHTLSTMHVPLGLMWELVERSTPLRELAAPAAQGVGADSAAPARSRERVLMKWTVVDALETCGIGEDCPSCALHADCGGAAKRAGAAAATGEGGGGAMGDGGHVSVSDARRLKGRVSLSVWNSEMMCVAPRGSACVFPEFDRALHIRRADELPGPEDVRRQCGAMNFGMMNVGVMHGGAGAMLVAGMDFGVRAPTVVLWALVRGPEHGAGAADMSTALGVGAEVIAVDDGAAAGPDLSAWHVTVLAEYMEQGRTLGEHIEAVKRSVWGETSWIGCDPAGHARNDQTGVSAIAAMQRAGLRARAWRTGVVGGLELIRARLSPASGPPSLMISDACPRLIRSLTRYRYASEDGGDAVPLKDGSDHAVDALRYLLVVLQRGHERARRYA